MQDGELIDFYIWASAQDLSALQLRGVKADCADIAAYALNNAIDGIPNEEQLALAKASFLSYLDDVDFAVETFGTMH